MNPIFARAERDEAKQDLEFRNLGIMLQTALDKAEALNRLKRYEDAFLVTHGACAAYKNDVDSRRSIILNSEQSRVSSLYDKAIWRGGEFLFMHRQSEKEKVSQLEKIQALEEQVQKLAAEVERLKVQHLGGGT